MTSIIKKDEAASNMDQSYSSTVKESYGPEEQELPAQILEQEESQSRMLKPEFNNINLVPSQSVFSPTCPNIVQINKNEPEEEVIAQNKDSPKKDGSEEESSLQFDPLKL